MTFARQDERAGGIALSIVVPCFNEAHALERLVHTVQRRFDPSVTELVLVDDGSTDDTAGTAARLLADLPNARLVSLPRNAGKGAAVRAGVETTAGHAVLFMDADLSTSLDDVEAFLARLEVADAVVGSRAIRGASATGSAPLRVLMGRSFSALARWLAGTRVQDSQCGFKAFRGDVAHLVFGLSSVDRFAFDPEVLRILRLTDHVVVEVPVVWEAGDHSTVRPVRDSVRTFVDLVLLRTRTTRRVVRRRAAAAGWTPPVATVPSGERPFEDLVDAPVATEG